MYHRATGEYIVRRELHCTGDSYWKIPASVRKTIITASSTLRNSVPSSKLLMKIDDRPKISMHNHLFLNLVKSFIIVKTIAEKGKPFFRKEQTKRLIHVVLSWNPKVWPFIWNMVLYISSNFLDGNFSFCIFSPEKLYSILASLHLWLHCVLKRKTLL